MRKTSPEGENRDLFEKSAEETRFEDLEKERPDVARAIQELKDPKLSKRKFFALIEEFNIQTPGDLEREGMYSSFSFEVSGVPGRSMRIKWFKNGAVIISGSDSGK